VLARDGEAREPSQQGKQLLDDPSGRVGRRWRWQVIIVIQGVFRRDEPLVLTLMGPAWQGHVQSDS
jgi:hypothetical protein